MKIRKLEKADYNTVDVCMKELHALHVAGRPDLYIPLEHIYTEQEFFSIVEDKRHIAIAAVDENGFNYQVSINNNKINKPGLGQVLRVSTYFLQ